MTICGTGHRPNRLGGHSKEALRRLIAVADAYLEEHPPELVISGAAIGWDTALAIAAIRRGIDTKAYIPFEGQESRWTVEYQKRYRKILSKCVSVVIVSKYSSFPVARMHQRNRLMVDDSDLVLAMWDGEEKGGTWNCIEYARKKGKEIVNLFERL